jgi:hypothetical protein
MASKEETAPKRHRLVLRTQQIQGSVGQSATTNIARISQVIVDPNKPRKQLDLQESLKKDLFAEKYDCMICFEKICKRQHTYSCSTCFAVFHLKCISTWAKKSENDSSEWRCPGCQTVSQDKPTVYYCFCTKQIQPEFNRLICPHSCGNTCAKDRGCVHKCPLPCHPGPCPPCNLYALPLVCACGKGLLKVTCKQKLQLDFIPSCGIACEKELKCGHHKCTLGCHPPPCPPCSVRTVVKCFCKQNERLVPCGEDVTSYSCQEWCPYTFECGHQCQEKCHEHLHQSKCHLHPSNLSTCPCGKFTIKKLTLGVGRQSCHEPIPSCNSICGKKRDCGHLCTLTCHSGDCPPCDVMIESSCRCGKSNRVTMPCHLLLVGADGTKKPQCTKICSTKLSCGRHRCNEKCCILTKNQHKCDRVCGKTLSCTKHQCLMPCGHEGNCHDCVEGASFDELACACGRTVMYPPIPCNTKPPKCNHPCERSRLCGHYNHNPHKCHPDDELCPPCTVFTDRQWYKEVT